MPLSFFNTLTKEKESFVPIKKDEVSMYTCGPTVYNFAHIGNHRAYVFADILKRVLLYNDFKVKHVMNLTDVDDKTIRDSQKENKKLAEFTEFYSQKFFEDIKSLGILEPSVFTKATDNIQQMVDLTDILLKKSIAYKSEDGSIYFNIRKFENYGNLSRLSLENQKENASGRIKKDEYEKDNVEDFALWKAWDENDGDVFWETHLGKGRPGWHIECSAMSMRFLGETLDIHTGGVDLIFPHHENEIAQSEGATEKQFVKYWVHNEWVLVDGKKMSKSLGNFYTLRDIVAKDINPLAFRLWLLMAHYRTKINFVWEALEGADTALNRLYALYNSLGEDMGTVDQNYREKFKQYINDDLDTPRALTVLWEVLKDESLSPSDKKATVLDFDKVLGLGFVDAKTKTKEEVTIPDNIAILLEERKKSKADKDFKKSDELRAEINSLGYEVKDTKDGQEIYSI
ncbi:MAG: cysteine--tRNA ligase [Patescibacteria group bacterium]